MEKHVGFGRRIGESRSRSFCKLTLASRRARCTIDVFQRLDLLKVECASTIANRSMRWMEKLSGKEHIFADREDLGFKFIYQ